MNSIGHWVNPVLWRRYNSVESKQHICILCAEHHAMPFLRVHPVPHQNRSFHTMNSLVLGDKRLSDTQNTVVRPKINTTGHIGEST